MPTTDQAKIQAQLDQGDWCLTYIGTSRMIFRMHDTGTSAVTFNQYDSIILTELDALKFLRFMQQQDTALLKMFVIHTNRMYQ